MNNIKISKNMIDDSLDLDNNISPKRIAVASNILLLISKKNTKEKYILMYNYDPINWKQIYPYFLSFSINYNFTEKTFKELIEKANSLLAENNMDDEKRKEICIEKFSETLGVKCLQLEEIESLPNEYWLKFSKTQNVWTLYLIEFYIAILDKEISINDINLENKFLLPISQESISEIIKTGKYGNSTIVDNTVEIFKNEEVLNDLLKKIVIVE